MPANLPYFGPSTSSWNPSDHDVEQPPTAVGPIDGAVLTEISQWFERQGVAWSGTPGELSRAIGRPMQQVLYAVQFSSTALLLFGIAATVSREQGCPMVVCLRRLDNNLSRPKMPQTYSDGEVDDTGKCENEPPRAVRAGNSIALHSELEPSQNPMVWNVDEWRNKLILASLNPVEEPPADCHRLILLAILGVVVVCALSIAGYFARNEMKRTRSRSSPTSFIVAPQSPRQMSRSFPILDWS